MLLARLDSDRDEAGNKYETTRRKLIKFLGLWGCSWPEDQVDQTFSTTARKISEGEAIQDFNAYALAIARNVYKESVRNEINQRLRLSQKLLDADPSDPERREKCYQQCLSALSAQERELIVKYYEESEAPDRERLADELRISLNSLRVNAFRVRKKLGNCLKTCTERQSEI